MTASRITLPGEGEEIVSETVEGGDHDGEKLPGIILWGYDPDGNPVPAQVSADGVLLSEGPT